MDRTDLSPRLDVVPAACWQTVRCVGTSADFSVRFCSFHVFGRVVRVVREIRVSFMGEGIFGACRIHDPICRPCTYFDYVSGRTTGARTWHSGDYDLYRPVARPRPWRVVDPVVGVADHFFHNGPFRLGRSGTRHLGSAEAGPEAAERSGSDRIFLSHSNGCGNIPP